MIPALFINTSIVPKTFDDFTIRLFTWVGSATLHSMANAFLPSLSAISAILLFERAAKTTFACKFEK